MKAAVITGIGQISVETVPDPICGAKDVILEVAAVGICGTDLHILQGEFAPSLPIIPGHEFSGVIVEVGKDVAAGRAKIITGGGSNETAHAMQLYKLSEKAGADGIMIVTPYYNKPTQAGVLTHFRLIADATDLPVILYDIPGRAGIPIQFETMLRAAKHPNIKIVFEQPDNDDLDKAVSITENELQAHPDLVGIFG